jgi:hypothetical protein
VIARRDDERHGWQSIEEFTRRAELLFLRPLREVTGGDDDVGFEVASETQERLTNLRMVRGPEVEIGDVQEREHSSGVSLFV